MGRIRNYYEEIEDIQRQIKQCDKLELEWEELKKTLDYHSSKRKINIIIAKLRRRRKLLLKQYEKLTK